MWSIPGYIDKATLLKQCQEAIRAYRLGNRYCLCELCRIAPFYAVLFTIQDSIGHGRTLEMKLGVGKEVDILKKIELRVEWLEQLEEKLLLELKGN